MIIFFRTFVLMVRKSVALSSQCCHQLARFRHRNMYLAERGQFTSWSSCNKCLFSTNCGSENVVCCCIFLLTCRFGNNICVKTCQMSRPRSCREKVLITTTPRGKLAYFGQIHVAMMKTCELVATLTCQSNTFSHQ